MLTRYTSWSATRDTGVEASLRAGLCKACTPVYIDSGPVVFYCWCSQTCRSLLYTPKPGLAGKPSLSLRMQIELNSTSISHQPPSLQCLTPHTYIRLQHTRIYDVLWRHKWGAKYNRVADRWRRPEKTFGSDMYIITLVRRT